MVTHKLLESPIVLHTKHEFHAMNQKIDFRNSHSFTLIEHTAQKLSNNNDEMFYAL